ncbi:endoglucanase 1 [Mycena olivaceomarginata]|nr:endoglucanase 1 [Mycena olivaceomarginata]
MLLSYFTPYIFLCAAWAKILYAGVNESGGEFGVFSANGTVGTGLPGRFGMNCTLESSSTVDIFVDKEKVNFFRVTFLMERMCPLSFGLGSKFNETYFAEYADAINYITLQKGAYTLIDPHKLYAVQVSIPPRNRSSGSVCHRNTSDPTAATTQQFGDFWHELARRFVSNPKVVFGINNEPHDMPPSTASAPRGAHQLILAPGNGFTGGHSWTQVTGAGDAPSSDFLNKLFDPIRNTAIDVHEYLDIDFSGGHAECTQPGPSNLANVTTWLRQNHLKAGGNNENCFQQVDELVKYLAANDDPCCGPDTGSLEPGQGERLGRTGCVHNRWANAIRPNIPKRSGISSLH